MTHKFKIGQTVQLLQGNRYLATSSIGYTVIRQLPESNGELGYRIKSTRETFERVVVESQLMRA
jgi:hypothetical protein